MIISAFTKNDTEIYYKTIKRYGIKELNLYYILLENVDFDKFCCDKEKIINIIKWFLKGFNEDFLGYIQNKNGSFEDFHNEYMRAISEYIELLKSGFLK